MIKKLINNYYKNIYVLTLKKTNVGLYLVYMDFPESTKYNSFEFSDLKKYFLSVNNQECKLSPMFRMIGYFIHSGGEKENIFDVRPYPLSEFKMGRQDGYYIGVKMKSKTLVLLHKKDHVFHEVEYENDRYIENENTEIYRPQYRDYLIYNYSMLLINYDSRLYSK